VTILLVFAVLFGIYMAWNIGANDVANAVGTSVGSGALTLKQAVLIAALFEFAGAFFLGGSVTETLESGIVNPEVFDGTRMDYVYGMLAALLASGVWLQIASYCGWPVSTTHVIVGAVLGFGLVIGGFDAIHWGEMGSIALSWVISPVVGGALAYLVFSLIRHKILYNVKPVAAAKRLTPFLVFILFALLTIIILMGGLKNLNLTLNLYQVFGLAASIGLFTALIAYFLVKRIHRKPPRVIKQNMQLELGLQEAEQPLMRADADSLGTLQNRVQGLVHEVQEQQQETTAPEAEIESDYRTVERIFGFLQIIIACFMAFAHGSNDVANAIGPLAAIFNVLQGKPLHSETVPTWLLLLGGTGIVIGLATWGWRVIETVGKKITELTPSRGFAAGFGAAITTVLASKLGLPISTTHVVVGAVLGVGFARGIGAIDLTTIRDIAISWIVTVPAGALLSILFYFLLRALV
jgi:inorganic phosphate transporter, PiT family